ncbi:MULTISPECIES: glycosyltransferase family 2 protein [Flavobacterium]|uniref:Glycosyltransferase 2-like domain-containing protein n=1 Tax=Flavobacterium hankyongi TaxID=1176532 RepID=A0ABP9A957_9FLAO|nr:glycosyltransferase family 2 protein [Flavobacterium sp. N1846]
MNNILVSIIIPVYNVEKFIVETIESVLNQNFKGIELILVDDGSTDNSLKLCEQFLEKDYNITLLRQKNSGVSIARNNGLNQAKGKYIYFLDSDDTIATDFIKTSYEIAKKGDCDIVVVGDYYCNRIQNVFVLPTCALFLKLDFLENHQDIRFPEKIQPCEDGLFSHQLLVLTDKIGINPAAEYYYREHENQNHLMINNQAEKLLRQIPEWFRILIDFYKRYNLFQTHSIDLARFVEHEPFELRYLSMPFNLNQKKELHQLIKDFVTKEIFPFMSRKQQKRLSSSFLLFVNSKNSLEFDRKYILKLRKEKIICKAKLILINTIPFRKIRKSLRTQLKEKYNKLQISSI